MALWEALVNVTYKIKKEHEGLKGFLETSESNCTFDSIVLTISGQNKGELSEVFRLLSECHPQRPH